MTDAIPEEGVACAAFVGEAEPFDDIPTFLSAITGAVTFVMVTLRTQHSNPPRDRSLLEIEDLV